MNIGLFTDTHLGARGGSKIFREYFKWYYTEVFFPKLKENNITTLFMLGDFFDNRNHLSLSDIAFVNEVFLPLLDSYGITMYIIAGNHDLAFKNTNSITSLSVMEHSDKVVILKDEVETFEMDNQKFVFVPWINSNNYSEFMESLNSIENKEEVIILGHFEIQGFLMYKNSMRCEHGLDQSIFKEFKSVWSGHFHHPSKIGNVEYLGSLFHLTWQDNGDKRGFWIYNTEDDEKTYVENEDSLFSEILYEDDLELTDDELEAATSHQYVKVVINDEYDKIKFMDFYSKIISNKPIDIQIVNNYAILKERQNVVVDENENDSDDSDSSSKTVDEYILNYVDAVVKKTL